MASRGCSGATSPGLLPKSERCEAARLEAPRVPLATSTRPGCHMCPTAYSSNVSTCLSSILWDLLVRMFGSFRRGD